MTKWEFEQYFLMGKEEGESAGIKWGLTVGSIAGLFVGIILTAAIFHFWVIPTPLEFIDSPNDTLSAGPSPADSFTVVPGDCLAWVIEPGPISPWPDDPITPDPAPRPEPAKEKPAFVLDLPDSLSAPIDPRPLKGFIRSHKTWKMDPDLPGIAELKISGYGPAPTPLFSVDLLVYDKPTLFERYFKPTFDFEVKRAFWRGSYWTLSATATGLAAYKGGPWAGLTTAGTAFVGDWLLFRRDKK